MVYLDPEQLEALKTRARTRHMSLAELIRRLVKEYLDDRQAAPPVLPGAFAKIVALGSSGRRNVSERHDTYLGDALLREDAR
jgi:hypothetical protein